MRASILLLLVACADGAGSDEGPGRRVVPAPYTPPDDAAFADALVAHHRGAVDMAAEEVARGRDPEVVAMAEHMRAMQLAEIDEMTAVRAELDVPEAVVEPDPQMHHDMATLGTLSGEALDEAFLAVMIPHHATAVDLAHRALPRLERPELITIARDTEANQAREIGELRAMLDERSAPTAEE